MAGHSGNVLQKELAFENNVDNTEVPEELNHTAQEISM